MDKADILNAIRDTRREADSFGDNESETMSRLKEIKLNEVWQD